jgi:hypothetical protein
MDEGLGGKLALALGHKSFKGKLGTSYSLSEYYSCKVLIITRGVHF